MSLLVAVLVLGAATWAIVKKYEVRLVLILTALALSLVAGGDRFLRMILEDRSNWSGAASAFTHAPGQILRTFVSTFSNEKFVIPICCAMGFAFVLKETGCDQHLVRLLIRPFRSARPLLVPVTVFIAFFVNIPLISQTSTAVAVGTVLVPLLRAARVPALTIAAALVLGSSLGGELLNRAAPELRTVADALKADHPDSSSQDCVKFVVKLIGQNLFIATAALWLLCRWKDRNAVPSDAVADAGPEFVINPLKAMVPFVPLLILLATSPPLSLVDVPDSWLIKAAKDPVRESRLIGAAMLVGVLAAAATSPSSFRQTAKAFFEGAGYGFNYIIGLIVTASCFGEGIKLLGIDKMLGQAIGGRDDLLIPLAAAVPLAFGTLTGSGMAATQSLFEFFIAPSKAANADPFQIGAVVSIAAATGRTISPVAAVTLMVARMTETDPFAIARRVAIPALLGLAATVAWAMIVR